VSGVLALRGCLREAGYRKGLGAVAQAREAARREGLHGMPKVRCRLPTQGHCTTGDQAMKSRRWLNLGLLATGVVSAVSGFLIQFTYHMHHGAAARATRLVWGLGYAAWALVHQISSALMLGIVVWHLVLNRKPLFAMLTRGSAWRRQAPHFFALFTVAVITALGAWGAGTLFSSNHTEHTFIEIHDKIVIPMAVLMVIHIWQRRARLLR
jgi:hypothetical protein